jgi:hypothetical protein
LPLFAIGMILAVRPIHQPAIAATHARGRVRHISASKTAAAAALRRVV